MQYFRHDTLKQFSSYKLGRGGGVYFFPKDRCDFFGLFDTKIKQHLILTHRVSIPSLNPIPPGFFLEFLGLGGFKSPPPPLHKSESIDTIAMKLGG